MIRRRSGASLSLAIALALPLLTAGSTWAAEKFSFATLEGRVLAVGEEPGEGTIRILSVDLAPRKQPEQQLTVLLGPVEACREIGFEVEEGDEMRLRVLLAAEGEPVKAQKVLNLSRGVMVRFRTMRGLPLWNSRGAWQGSPGHSYQGGQRRGQGGRGPGSGPGRR